MKNLFFALFLAAMLPNFAHSDATNATPAVIPERSLPPLGGQWGFQSSPVTDPSLPKVLLIGDSILINQAPTVRRDLEGKANVDFLFSSYHVGDAKGLDAHLMTALPHGPYAVIHFNDMGLHGLADRIPEGQYEPGLRAYVAFLQKNAPGASLIWTSTTPLSVKDHLDQPGPETPVIVKRNAIAARVMKEQHIPIDDLYALMVDKPQMHLSDGCHWKAEGVVLQGHEVSSKIEAALKKRQHHGQ